MCECEVFWIAPGDQESYMDASNTLMKFQKLLKIIN